MGWTSLNRPKGQSNDDFFRAEFPNMLGTHGTILASTTKGGAYYAAVKGHYSDPNEVWCLVVLIRWGSGYYNFTYKEMSDSMGPAVDDCPDRILDLLTPTDNEYALEWRARCRAKNNRPKPRKGDTVVFANPIQFTNGDEITRFVYGGRGNQFAADGLRYSITGWRDREHTVERAA